MTLSLFRKTSLSFVLACIAFFGIQTVFAGGFEINSTNYPGYLTTQWGSFSVQGNTVVLSGSGQSILLLDAPRISGSIDIIELKNCSYAWPSVVLLWKVHGQEYSPSNQMALPLKDGKITLPQSLVLANFDFIGLGFLSPTVSFSSMTLREQDFSDKWTTFMEPELVKPSSINLLYGPKFGTTPFVQILGILAIILFIALVFVRRKWAFASLLVLWILFDIRYSYDQYSILKTTYRTFVAQEKPENKIYYDFYNFYGFIEESKKYMKGGTNFYAPSEWPFQSNYLYHLYPLKVTWQTSDQPYYAIFQMNNVELRNGKELFIDGKLIDGSVQLLSRFDGHSYILKKN